jgi:hypothetical protein
MQFISLCPAKNDAPSPYLHRLALVSGNTAISSRTCSVSSLSMAEMRETTVSAASTLNRIFFFIDLGNYAPSVKNNHGKEPVSCHKTLYRQLHPRLKQLTPCAKFP